MLVFAQVGRAKVTVGHLHAQLKAPDMVVRCATPWRLLMTSAVCKAAQKPSCWGLQRLCSLFTATPSLPRGDPTGPPAFVFDIDGVLVRGKTVLPTARQAMAQLCPDGRWSYAVCFMTNGGGMLEADKAEQLSSWLQVPVEPSQVILSHTPMRQLVPQLEHKPILVSGRGNVLEVANHYGFKRVLSTFELGAATPSATPFSSYPAATPAQHISTDKLLGIGSEQHPIEAVLVMNDPDDWYRDLQLIVDVIMSGGVPQRRGGPPPGTRPVQLFFSNPDLLWANEHPRPRFGQGAFAHAVMALSARVAEATSQAVPLSVQWFGKPNPAPYRLAEQLLLKQAQELGFATDSAGQAELHGNQLPFSAIYAVGDNPAADVRGANAAGAPWVSMLVQTGVFQGPGINCSIDPAAVPVNCVSAAVQAGLHRARFSRFHSMR